jgi:hypothetical protein
MAIAEAGGLLTKQGHEVRASHLGDTISVMCFADPRNGATIGAIQIGLKENSSEVRVAPSFNKHVHIRKGDETAATCLRDPLVHCLDGLWHCQQTNGRIKYPKGLHGMASWL